MGFDIFSAIMAVLSILSFGAIGGADITEEVPEIEIISGTTDTKPQTAEPAGPTPTPTPAADTRKPGADLIAGAWSGKASIPFMVSVEFFAEAAEDGTARFSGTVTSSVFGNHVFDTPAEWVHLGGNSFNTIISGTDTAVTCDGKTLTFPLNPYKLGLVDNEIADQEFIIDLQRI